MKRLQVIAVAGALTILSAAGPRIAPAAPPEAKSSHALKAEEEKALYRCPMHPEVTSDKRDRCPKCGMYLEKVRPSAEAHEGHQH